MRTNRSKLARLLLLLAALSIGVSALGQANFPPFKFNTSTSGPTIRIPPSR